MKIKNVVQNMEKKKTSLKEKNQNHKINDITNNNVIDKNLFQALSLEDSNRTPDEEPPLKIIIISPVTFFSNEKRKSHLILLL